MPGWWSSRSRSGAVYPLRRVRDRVSAEGQRDIRQPSREPCAESVPKTHLHCYREKFGGRTQLIGYIYRSHRSEGQALCVGGAYSLPPPLSVNHRDTGQSWASVSPCMRKRADSGFPRSVLCCPMTQHGGKDVFRHVPGRLHLSQRERVFTIILKIIESGIKMGRNKLVRRHQLLSICIGANIRGFFLYVLLFCL